MAPVRVVAIDAASCLVQVGDHTERVTTLPLAGDELAEGDWVLVTGSMAIRRLEPEQAGLVAEAVERAHRSSDEEVHDP